MKCLQTEEGFTLVEVIASIVIFSVALLLFSTFFVNSFGLSKKQDTQMVANNLARQTAESWRSGNATIDENMEIVAGGGTLPSEGTSLTYNTLYGLLDKKIKLSPITINERSYHQSVEITRYDGEIEDNPLILIKVTVESSENSGRPLAKLYAAMPNPAK